MTKRKLRSPEYRKRKNKRKELRRLLSAEYRNKKAKRGREIGEVSKSKASDSQEYKKKKNKRKELRRLSDTEYQRKRANRGREIGKSSQSNSSDYIEKKRIKNNSRKRNVSELRKNSMHKYWLEVNQSDNQSIIDIYENTVREGPIEKCQSCEGLFFKKSIIALPKETVLGFLGEDIFHKIWPQIDCQMFSLCVTCRNTIVKSQIPRLCLVNGLEFPPIPDVLKGLSPLEEILCSQRLLFIRITEKGVDKQFGISGNVVNVPIDVNNIVNVLPRLPSNTETIELKLKRRSIYKSAYKHECVRLGKVYSAVEFLVKTPLYQKEGVRLSDNWHKLFKQEIDAMDMNSENEIESEEIMADDWDETRNDQKLSPGSEQTLLKEGIVFTPGEGQTPISILFDEDAEEMAFPTVYCGQKLVPTVKMSYSDRVKSEIRRSDRRCIKIPKLFFMYRKKEMLALREAINIHVRRASNSRSLNASKALDSSVIENLCCNDEAYKVLAGDRSSPAYWQKKMKETMAMIRQIGVPTFFLTLSAAETHWGELLVILAKGLDNRTISEEEAVRLSYMEKCDLIRRDPVISARYFDHRFRALFKLLKSKGGPFGEYAVVDWYIRIEFQHRGSPHVHCLVWLKDAPEFDTGSAESKDLCERFINRFISCSSGEVGDLSKYQYHKHTKSCQRFKQDSAVCRFGIPYFPMKKTTIIEPLDEKNLSEEEIETIEGNLDRIETIIKEIDTELRNKAIIDFDFNDFLLALGLDELEYITAIRYTLKRSAVFLERGPKDIRINGFNADILRRHRANMDIQFVLEPYACVHYVLNYINKSYRGMSELLRQVIDECKSGYMTHQQKLSRICSKFINCSEVSAQEAVYHLLSMPLSISSRASIFINTGERETRIRVLKSRKELELLDPDCSDVMALGILDYYVLRPDELESVCLAEFASFYNFSKTKKPKKSREIEEDIEEQLRNDSNESGVFALKRNKGFITKRKFPKIIRYRKYQFEKDEYNFFREKIMLYMPWRDEDLDIIGVDCRQKFCDNENLIVEKERRFVKNCDYDYDKLREEVEQNNLAEYLGQEMTETVEEFQVYDTERPHLPIDQELGIKSKENNPKSGFFSTPMLKEDAFSDVIRSLNYRQRKYLLGVLNLVKTKKEPFYHFITGGAGTGKSRLIQALYQSMSRYLNFRFQKPDKVKVLLLGPTGKSAFNIGGSTIHSALGVPVSQNISLPNMNAERRNAFRTKFWELKVIVIDEISMVGASTLRKIDHQLKQIFDSPFDFGGISIIAVGDLNQLRPVMDRFVFEFPSKADYSVLAGPKLWRLFSIYTLDEIMRQKDDLVFAKALNNLATGNVSENDLALFRSRLFEKSDVRLPSNAIRLFPTNEQVYRYNDMMINNSREVGYRVEAIDSVQSGTTPRIREKALKSVSFLRPQNTYGLSKVLLLKTSIRYMVTTNMEVNDGIVNGTTGILRIIDLNMSGEPEILWFEFEGEHIGLNHRSKMKPKLFGELYLTPISRVTRDIQMKTEANITLVSRTQFPLLAAEAMTIHKAQGQTYNEVVVDLSRKLDLSKMYVALSRAKKCDGLFLIGKEIKSIVKRPASHPIEQELSRLHKDSQLSFELKCISEMEIDSNATKIYFHNLPHLHKHIDDLDCDLNVMSVDLLFLVETHSNGNSLSGFELCSELAYRNHKPFGIAIYKRRNLESKVTWILSDAFECNGDSHIEYIAIHCDGKVYLVVYASPEFPIMLTMDILSRILPIFYRATKKIVVIGDLNIDINSSDGKELMDSFASIGLSLSVGMNIGSNSYGNQIDLVFSSFKIETMYYETVSLDHKPIFCIVN